MTTRSVLISGCFAAIVCGAFITPSEAETLLGRLEPMVVDRQNGVPATEAQVVSYGYPYRDPYLATMTSALLNADGVTLGLKRTAVHVPVLPGRNHLPS